MATEPAPHPPIRTFRPRRSRVTRAQQRALDAHGPSYLLPVSGHPVDLSAVFGREAPLVVEIGFGSGEATARLAEAEPGRDVLAVDVHTPGVGALLARLAASGTANVRLVVGDGVEVLRDMLAPASVDELRVFFPDPWPKPRHHKRRLVQPPFLSLVASRLVPGGRLHLATDVPGYARQMRAVVEQEPALRLVDATPLAARRPVTRYEGIARSEGRDAVDLVAERRQDPDA